MIAGGWRLLLVGGLFAATAMLSACSQSTAKLTQTVSVSPAAAKAYNFSPKDKDCLARAMFFESKRSSREGLVAVGTVVMNRLQSGIYGDSVCNVVGQKGQFAPGVLSRPMNSTALPDVEDAADSVLKGERHPKVKDAMFFHTAGLKFPYKNMHYVLVAGGNAFYEKTGQRHRLPDATAAPQVEIAQADLAPTPTLVASADLPRPTLDPGTGDAASALGPVLSYEASPQAADAIGAMIASQDRPLEE